MPEVKEKLDTFKIKMMCKICNIGEMLPNGKCLTSNPPQYPHECSNKDCNNVESYRAIYPKIVYE